MTPLLKTTVICWRSNENSSNSSTRSSQDYKTSNKESNDFSTRAMALQKQLKDKMKEVPVVLGVQLQGSLLPVGQTHTLNERSCLQTRSTLRWSYCRFQFTSNAVKFGVMQRNKHYVLECNANPWYSKQLTWRIFTVSFCGHSKTRTQSILSQKISWHSKWTEINSTANFTSRVA